MSNLDNLNKSIIDSFNDKLKKAKEESQKKVIDPKDGLIQYDNLLEKPLYTKDGKELLTEELPISNSSKSFL